jgi:hypothetical protein
MRHLGNKVALVVAAIAIAAIFAAAQAPAQRPSFEVASIKPSDPNQRGATIQKFVGGRFVAKGVSLRPLMTYAFGIRIPELGTAPSVPPCGEGIGRYQLRLGRGSMEGCAVELRFFVESLSQQVGRTIVDKTGLKGLYNINLQWTPETPPQNNSASPTEAAPPIDANGPSIFTAIQEQLGLRLESTKGPVEVLVIDSVQKPSEN